MITVPRATRRWLVALTVLPLALAGCGQAGPTADPAGGVEISVDRCDGSRLSFARVPERVVTLDGWAAHAMVRLGLGDRVIGTGYPAPFRAAPAADSAALTKLKVLASDVPATEVVAAQRPDLVLTAFSAFGGPPGSPKETDLATMGAQGLAACELRPGGGPGAMAGGMAVGGSGAPVTDLAATYQYLTRLGQLFQVPDRAEQLITELRGREKAALERVGSRRPVRVLALASDPVPGQPISALGGASIANAIIKLAGGENVVTDAAGMHATVSPEKVIERDPEVIWVVSDFSFAKLTGPELLSSVSANPLLAPTSAIRARRLLLTSQYLVAFPSPLNLEGLDLLATELARVG